MQPEFHARRVWFARFILIACAYYATGRLGLSVPYVGSHITLIWPPTGIALAALLRWPLSLWPAVWLGAFGVNLAVGSSVWLAFGIACGNTFGPWLAARLIRRRDFEPNLLRSGDLLRFLAIGVAGGMAVTATNGVAQLWLAGLLPFSLTAVAEAWLTWWLGDAMGALVVGIPLLTFERSQVRELFAGRRGAELGGILLLTVAIGAVAFIWRAANAPLSPILYLPFFLLCWLAVRGSSAIASTAALLLSAEAVWATANGGGPFHATDIHNSLAFLWSYMGTATIITVFITMLIGELRASERRLALATVGAELGLWEWDLAANRITYAGADTPVREVAPLPDDISWDSWAASVHPDDLPQVEQSIAGHLGGTNDLFEAEYRMRRRNGGWVWLLARGQVVERDAKGGPTKLAGTLLNIDKRKKSEAALLASEYRFRQTFETNQAIKFIIDPADGSIEDANQAACEFYGYSLAQMLTLKIADINILPADEVKAEMERAHAEQRLYFNFRHRLASGEIREVEVYSGPIDTDRGERLYSIVHDVTERKRAEEREHRQRKALVTLNEVAALSHLPLGEQLRRALAIVAAQLDLPFGIVSHVVGDSYTVVAQVSPPDTLQDGQEFALGHTYCDITLRHRRVVAISEMRRSPYLGHPCYETFKLEAYIGAPIYVGGEVYGTVNFSSPQPYPRQFDSGDTEFVTLLARWVGSVIERDQASRRLMASEAYLQAIIDNEPECVKVIAPDGTVTQMNRAGLDMLEAESVEEVNAAGLVNFVAPEHRQAFRDLNAQVLTGKTATLEFLVVGREGRRGWLDTHAAPLRDAAGRVYAVLGVTRDITETKRAESELRLAASVFGHAHEGIMICNAKRVVVDVNPTFSEITGYARDEIIGRTPKLLSSGRHDQAFYRTMWQAVETQGFWDGEIWNRRKDGSGYVEHLTISTVRDDEGSITHYIGSFSDVTELHEQRARLEYMAHYDALTQLPNRTMLGDRLVRALARVKRGGGVVAVCYLDLDGFKAVNDELGHDAGDALLVEVALRLKQSVRESDTVVRMGGDEFVLVLSLNAAAECSYAMERVIVAIAKPFEIAGQARRVSCSIGITLYPDDDSDPDMLLRHADQAMLAVKVAGKNRYEFYRPGAKIELG